MSVSNTPSFHPVPNSVSHSLKSAQSPNLSNVLNARMFNFVYVPIISIHRLEQAANISDDSMVVFLHVNTVNTVNK